MTSSTHAGFISIIGQPNVGKSTLLNALLGRKVSITSRKPQTTRHRLLGIKTVESTQMIFVDTPGFQLGFKRALNRVMNKNVKIALKDVDAILFVIEALYWNKRDEAVLKLLRNTQAPVILVVNKIDKIKLRETLLPFIQSLQEKFSFKAIIPISAKNHTQLEVLEKMLLTLMPEGPFLYEPHQMTDRDERFLASEIIREKVMRQTGEEVPYSTNIMIEQFEQDGSLLRISAVIWVEKDGQKAIMIGEKGEKLKRIGTDARKELEKLLGQKIFLQLWVKVKSGWSDNPSLISQLGYDR
ncbi:MAG TPA: GTPase Era [Coxiellaceae bacterium]|nr:GTPase Era [Coxiellaceae bacterium]